MILYFLQDLDFSQIGRSIIKKYGSVRWSEIWNYRVYTVYINKPHKQQLPTLESHVYNASINVTSIDWFLRRAISKLMKIWKAFKALGHSMELVAKSTGNREKIVGNAAKNVGNGFKADNDKIFVAKPTGNLNDPLNVKSGNLVSTASNIYAKSIAVDSNSDKCADKIAKDGSTETENASKLIILPRKRGAVTNGNKSDAAVNVSKTGIKLCVIFCAFKTYPH